MPSSFKQHLSSLCLDAGIQEAVIFAMIGRRRHEGNPRVCEMKFLMISLSNSRKMSCSTWILFISKHKYLKMCHNEGLKSFFPLANKTVVADGVRFYFSYIYIEDLLFSQFPSGLPSAMNLKKQTQDASHSLYLETWTASHLLGPWSPLQNWSESTFLGKKCTRCIRCIWKICPVVWGEVQDRSLFLKENVGRRHAQVDWKIDAWQL